MLPDSATAVLDEAHAALADTIRVGVLLPWANAIVEAELPRLSLDRVIFHYARLVPASRTTGLDHRFLRELVSAVPASLAEVSRLPLATTLLACASAGFTKEEEASLPVASAFDALVTTLNRMSINRIALVTPYPRWLTAIEVRALVANLYCRSSNTHARCRLVDTNLLLCGRHLCAGGRRDECSRLRGSRSPR